MDLDEIIYYYVGHFYKIGFFIILQFFILDLCIMLSLIIIYVGRLEEASIKYYYIRVQCFEKSEFYLYFIFLHTLRPQLKIEVHIRLNGFKTF